MNLFNEDSFLHSFFLSAGGFIGLNLLWIITSVPVITAGASTTALYYCTLKLHKDKDISIWKCYWKSFRENFFQATAVWLGLAGAGACIWLEERAVRTMPAPMCNVFVYVIWGMAFGLLITALYIFPVIASFENKIRRLVPYTLYFAARKPGYALCMAAVTCLPMYFTLVDVKLFPVYLLIWLMCGFSLTAYCNSWFLWKLFKPYFPENGGEGERTGAEPESDHILWRT